MKIELPYVSQADLEYAIDCLEACKQKNAKKYGFNYPYFSPGGGYGEQWWQLDSSLALCGYKWIDRSLCEQSLLNFTDSQKADGRICLWGADSIPSQVAGANFPLQTEGVSSLPKLFDTAYGILRGSRNGELKRKVYLCLKRYLDWWFENRYDKETGLISAVFEETFIPYLRYSGEYAPVDTNVEVYVGCICVKALSEELGDIVYANEVGRRAELLKESINKYLWCESKGAYFPYYLKEKRHGECLMASTFYPLRMGIAPKERQERLLALLTDDAHFNWDTIALTSVSKKDKEFTVTHGAYQGNASWSGSVWTLINETVVRGLCDVGEKTLAAELALKTLRAFASNCTEFVNPFDRSGHGVEKYAWTASQYLELIIEIIFGISYDAERGEIKISPRLTEELAKERISLCGLRIAEGLDLDVTVDRGTVSAKVSNSCVKITQEL